MIKTKIEDNISILKKDDDLIDKDLSRNILFWINTVTKGSEMYYTKGLSFYIMNTIDLRDEFYVSILNMNNEELAREYNMNKKDRQLILNVLLLKNSAYVKWFKNKHVWLHNTIPDSDDDAFQMLYISIIETLGTFVYGKWKFITLWFFMLKKADNYLQSLYYKDLRISKWVAQRNNLIIKQLNSVFHNKIMEWQYINLEEIEIAYASIVNKMTKSKMQDNISKLLNRYHDLVNNSYILSNTKGWSIIFENEESSNTNDIVIIENETITEWLMNKEKIEEILVFFKDIINRNNDDSLNCIMFLLKLWIFKLLWVSIKDILKKLWRIVWNVDMKKLLLMIEKWEEESLQWIGDVFNITKERVRQRVKKFTELLKWKELPNNLKVYNTGL